MDLKKNIVSTSNLLQVLVPHDTKWTNRLDKINEALTLMLKRNNSYSGLVNVPRTYPMVQVNSGLQYIYYYCSYKLCYIEFYIYIYIHIYTHIYVKVCDHVYSLFSTTTHCHPLTVVVVDSPWSYIDNKTV